MKEENTEDLQTIRRIGKENKNTFPGWQRESDFINYKKMNLKAERNPLHRQGSSFENDSGFG
jgi:hypothetical protein